MKNENKFFYLRTNPDFSTRIVTTEVKISKLLHPKSCLNDIIMMMTNQNHSHFQCQLLNIYTQLNM